MGLCTLNTRPPAVTPALETRQWGWTGWSTVEVPSPHRHFRKLSFAASQTYELTITSHTGGYTQTDEITQSYTFSGYILYLEDGSKEYHVSGSGAYSRTITDSTPGGYNDAFTGGGTYGSPDVSTPPSWTWGGSGGGSGGIEAILSGSHPYSPINTFTDPDIYEVTVAVDTLNAFGTYDLTGVFTGWEGSEANSFSATFEDPCPLGYQLEHSPTASCFLRAYLTLTEGETETPIEYAWTGSGGSAGLCLLDSTKAPGHADNKIVTDWIDLDLPDPLDAEQLLTLTAWSFLPGYVPGAGDPNGWPA